MTPPHRHESQIASRSWWSGAAGFIIAILVMSLVTNSLWLALLVSLVYAVISRLLQSPLLSGAAFVVGVSASGFVLYVLLSLSIVTSIAAFWVLLLLCAATATATGLIHRSIPRNSWFHHPQSAFIAILLLAGWFLATISARLNPVYYAFLMGEDHGSKLNVARQLIESQGALSSASFANSGWFSGLILALISVVFSFGDDSVPNLASFDVALRAYTLTAGLFVVSSAISFTALMTTVHDRFRRKLGLAIFGTGVTLPWAMAATFYGHYGAVVALFTVGCTGQIAVFLDRSSRREVVFASVMFLCAMALAIGGSWYPMLPISFWIAIGVASILFVRKWRSSANRSWKMRLIVGAILVAVMSIGVVYVRSFNYLIDIENVLKISKYPGGVTRIGTNLVLFMLIGAALFGIRSGRSYFRFVHFSLGGAVLGAVSLNYLQGIGYPEYGASKLIGVVVGGLFVFALPPLFEYCSRLGARQHVNVLVPVFIVAGLFVFALQPLYDFGRMIVNRPGVDDYSGVRKVLAADRTAVCLSTMKEDGYRQYKCSRILLGAQGQHDTEYGLFMAGNLCSVASKQLFEIGPERLAQLAVIISDPTQLSSVDDCQARGWAGEGLVKTDKYLTGWTSAIPWGSVKIYDFEGNVVTPSFDYLKKYDDYSDEDIQLLTSTLSK